MKPAIGWTFAALLAASLGMHAHHYYVASQGVPEPDGMHVMRVELNLAADQLQKQEAAIEALEERFDGLANGVMAASIGADRAAAAGVDSVDQSDFDELEGRVSRGFNEICSGTDYRVCPR